MGEEAPQAPERCSRVMPCSHRGFRDISSTYDLHRQVLVFFWSCERCGKHMGEAGRTRYQPRYEPTRRDAPVTSEKLNG